MAFHGARQMCTLRVDRGRTPRTGRPAAAGVPRGRPRRSLPVPPSARRYPFRVSHPSYLRFIWTIHSLPNLYILSQHLVFSLPLLSPRPNQFFRPTMFESFILRVCTHSVCTSINILVLL